MAILYDKSIHEDHLLTGSHKELPTLIIVMNEGGCIKEVLGNQPEETEFISPRLQGRSFPEIFRSEEKERILAFFPVVREKAVIKFIGNLIYSDFSIRQVEVTLFSHSGNFIAFIHDAAALKASLHSRRLHTAITQIKEAVVITDTEGNIEYVNSSFEQVTGYEAKEALGRNPRILKSGEHEDSFYKEMWETISRGEIWEGRIVNKRKNGKTYTEETTISPVTDGSGKIVNYVAVKRDISDELQQLQQMYSLQKTEAIGELASGIAHDFNNILQSILGFTDIARGKMHEGSLEHEILQKVITAADRAKALIRQILNFGRSESEGKKPIQLQPILREAVDLISASFPSTVAIKQEITNAPLFVNADSTHIHQILMNLSTNALHAMRDTGGILRVHYKLAKLEEDITWKGRTLSPGDFALLEVQDTGCGMEPAIIEKIFKPYFSTKSVGEGTGLGLSVVAAIVDQHEGAIIVESTQDEGTTFKIFLPICDVEQVEKIEAEAANPAEGNGQRILFVDDEESIVELAKRAITRRGYKVAGFTNSSEAIESFKEALDDYDLIITDATMPEQTGIDLIKRARLVSPSTPIILCSGNVDDALREKALTLGVEEVIVKPYTSRELHDAIARALSTD